MQSNKSVFYFPFFLVIYELTVYLANDLIMPGMIQVINDFQVNNSFVPSSLSAFLIGGASLQIFLGPLADFYGKRKVMLFGCVFFFLSTIYILGSQSIFQFMTGRFFQGMGLCFIGTVGYAAIQELYQEKQAVKLISIMSTVTVLAPLAGPLLGGIYTSFFHWRGIYVIVAILSSIAVIGLYFYMPQFSQKKDDTHFIENYKLIFKNKVFLIGCLAISISHAPLMAWIAISPLILIKKAHLTSEMYGICQIPIFGSFIIGNFILQKILPKFELKNIICFGSIFIILSLIFTSILPFIFGESYFYLLIPLSLYSFGLAIENTALTRLVLYASTVSKSTVSAVLSLISTLIYAFSTYAMVFIYHDEKNLTFGLYCCAMGILFSPLIYIFLQRARSHDC